ncbi:hypothetical protein HaLaN_31950, partial [Haematococcus lacustris]
DLVEHVRQRLRDMDAAGAAQWAVGAMQQLKTLLLDTEAQRQRACTDARIAEQAAKAAGERVAAQTRALEATTAELQACE